MDDEMDPTVSCAENISLLFLLHSVPREPNATPIRTEQKRQAEYSLPFEKEQELANTLAFLSSIRDDPNRIPALCIECIPDVDALKVHIAVNKSSFDDGNTDLLERSRALSKILAPLSRLTDTDKKAVKVAEIFDVIMAVSAERILGRLGLRPSNKQKMKKPVAETLQLAVTSLRTLHQEISSRAGLVDSATAFESRANEVVKLIAVWTKHQTPIRLKDIVEGIHKLWMIERLDELFDCIPNNLMDPKLRTSLQNIIGKVARYKEAARCLYRMAKKFPAVRRAEIVSVTLQQHMFAKVEVNNYSPSLPSALNRIARKHNLSINYAQICSLLGLNKEQVERKFSDNVRRALQGAKVHAEVQLFYHIEMLRLARPPRVVCSNKDACYLCDFFIAVTKKVHSPKCHGRLYPGWRLPASSIHDQTLGKFSHALEEKVRDSVRTLLKSQKKFRLPDPRESTIFEIARSVSTLAPSSTSPSAVDVATDDNSISSNGITSGSMDQSTHTLLNECLQAAEEHSVPHNDEISTIESNASKTTHDLSQLSLLSGKQASARQKSEMKRTERISACVISNDVSCICIGPLRLYVEYSASHNKDIEHTRRELKFDVEWITHINDGPVRQDVGSSVIEIETSAYTASLPLNTMNQLDTNCGGRILRIRMYP